MYRATAGPTSNSTCVVSSSSNSAVIWMHSDLLWCQAYHTACRCTRRRQGRAALAASGRGCSSSCVTRSRSWARRCLIQCRRELCCACWNLCKAFVCRCDCVHVLEFCRLRPALAGALDLSPCGMAGDRRGRRELLRPQQGRQWAICPQEGCRAIRLGQQSLHEWSARQLWIVWKAGCCQPSWRF